MSDTDITRTAEPAVATQLDEDDHLKREFIRDVLSAVYMGDDSGARTLVAGDGLGALHLVREDRPDLVVLDLMLPGDDGLSLLRRLRDQGDDLPVVMLTAKGDAVDRIIGLEQGADDYLAKPFDLEELMVRVKALLRRSERAPLSSKHNEILSYGCLTMVPERFEAIWFDQPVRLTHLEFELLHCLLQRHGQTVAPSLILKEVWGYEPDDDIETIRVHIRHLRTKLEPDPRKPRFIKTVYGAGYCLEQCLLSGAVTLCPCQPALIGPPAITVHDHGNVLWYRVKFRSRA